MCVCVYIYIYIYIYMCVCVCIYICTLCIHTHVCMHVYLLCIACVRELEPPTFRGPENSPLHAVSCAYVQHQLCIRTHASHTHIHHDAHTHVRWEKHAKSALGGVCHDHSTIYVSINTKHCVQNTIISKDVDRICAAAIS